MLVLVALASPTSAVDLWPPDPGGGGSAPEIGAAAITGGIALLAGGILIIRSRRRK